MLGIGRKKIVLNGYLFNNLYIILYICINNLTKKKVQERLSRWLKEDEHLTTNDNNWSIHINDISEMDGEVNWYNRKGKLFTLYDLKITLSFSGKLGDQDVEGKIKISDFEQDSEDKADFRCNVTKGPNEAAWKTWCRDAMKKRFLELWAKVIVELHEDQKQKVPALTTKEGAGKLKLPEVVQEKAAAVTTPPPAVAGTVVFSLVIQASLQDVWDLFTNTQKTQFFSQSAANIDAKEGGAFSLYDGVISGCFLDLKPYTEMRFAWRLKDWKPGVNSQVHLKFTKSKDGTKLEIVQTNVPSNDIDRTREGWKRYYYERWRGVFGYNYEMK